MQSKVLPHEWSHFSTFYYFFYVDNVATSSKQDNYFYPDCSRYRSLPFFCIYKRESPDAHKRLDFPPFLITCGIRRAHGRGRTNRVKICFNGQCLRLQSSSLRVKVPQNWRWLTCLHFRHHKDLLSFKGPSNRKGCLQGCGPGSGCMYHLLMSTNSILYSY